MRYPGNEVGYFGAVGCALVADAVVERWPMYREAKIRVNVRTAAD